MIKQLYTFVVDFAKEPGNPFEQLCKFFIFIPIGVLAIVSNPIVKKIKTKI